MRKEVSEIQKYIESYYPPESESKQLSRQLAEELHLSGISIAPMEAKLIQFMMRLIHPKKILEIGTLTGLSAQYFIETLQSNSDCKVVSLEKSEEHFQRAYRVLNDEIKNRKCELILGDAREKLKEINDTFDCIFIDGNKAAYLDYWNWAKDHISQGGLIFIDNVFLSGAVWHKENISQKFSTKQISIMQEMTQSIFKDAGFDAIFVPTEEGLLVCQKK